jgi:hypothetical protein
VRDAQTATLLILLLLFSAGFGERGKPRDKIGDDVFCATIDDGAVSTDQTFEYMCIKNTASVVISFGCIYPFDLLVTGVGVIVKNTLSATEDGTITYKFGDANQSALDIDAGPGRTPICDITDEDWDGDLDEVGDSCFRFANVTLLAGEFLRLILTADGDSAFTSLQTVDVCIHYRPQGLI